MGRTFQSFDRNRSRFAYTFWIGGWHIIRSVDVEPKRARLLLAALIVQCHRGQRLRLNTAVQNEGWILLDRLQRCNDLVCRFVSRVHFDGRGMRKDTAQLHNKLGAFPFRINAGSVSWITKLSIEARSFQNLGTLGM